MPTSFLYQENFDNLILLFEIQHTGTTQRLEGLRDIFMNFEAFSFFIIIIIKIKIEFVRLIGRTDGMDLLQMFELISEPFYRSLFSHVLYTFYCHLLIS